jgi:hypothetical protein
MPPQIPWPLPRPPTLSNPSPAALASHLAQTSPTPLLLPQLTRDWPALAGPSRWGVHPPDELSRLRQSIGEDRAVEVELGPRGRGYMDERYRRVTMGFGGCYSPLCEPYEQLSRSHRHRAVSGRLHPATHPILGTSERATHRVYRATRYRSLIRSLSRDRS